MKLVEPRLPTPMVQTSRTSWHRAPGPQMLCVHTYASHLDNSPHSIGLLIAEAGTIEVFGKCQIEGIQLNVLERAHLKHSNLSASKE